MNDYYNRDKSYSYKVVAGCFVALIVILLVLAIKGNAQNNIKNDASLVVRSNSSGTY